MAVSDHFNCSGNKLTSLEHGPKTVGLDYYCGGNRLASLKGAPAEGVLNFYCEENPFDSLEGAPRKFGMLHTDWGALTERAEVDKKHRQLLKRNERREQKRQASVNSIATSATVLGAPLQISKPLCLKR